MGYVEHNKEEHQKAKDLAGKIEAAKKDDKKRTLFNELFVMIYAHHTAEESAVYPKLKQRVKGDDLSTILEMIEEHHLGNYQFSLLDRTSNENETWDAKFAVLKEVLEHHMDEEEQEIGPMIQKEMTKEENDMLLEAFEKVYAEKEKEKKKDLK